MEDTAEINPLIIKKLKKAFDLKKNGLIKKPSIEPVEVFLNLSPKEYEEIGKKKIAEGKVGCILLAGGLGSRLGFLCPKGMVPFSPIKKRTLFQCMAEKIKIVSLRCKTALPLAIMVNQDTLLETKKYFEENHFFGLKKEQVSFFTQKSLPFLSLEGKIFFEKEGKIAEGPSGNGDVFSSFKESHLLKNWEEKGIEVIEVIPVDNPLIDPYDFSFLGFHFFSKQEVTAVAIERNSAEEKMGVFVKEEGKIAVREYFELTAEDNKLLSRFAWANMGVFAFDISFFSKAALHPLPFHFAFKKLSFLNAKGATEIPQKENGWKIETFIFDALPLANSVALYPEKRENVFSPLKNKTGKNSLEEVQKDFMEKERKMLEEITQEKQEALLLELAPSFYYADEPFKKKWEGKKMSLGGYIDEQ